MCIKRFLYDSTDNWHAEQLNSWALHASLHGGDTSQASPLEVLGCSGFDRQDISLKSSQFLHLALKNLMSSIVCCLSSVGKNNFNLSGVQSWEYIQQLILVLSIEQEKHFHHLLIQKANVTMYSQISVAYTRKQFHL